MTYFIYMVIAAIAYLVHLETLACGSFPLVPLFLLLSDVL